MKKNILLSLAFALAVFLGNSAVATTFYNQTSRNVRVMGVGNTGWNIPPAQDSVANLSVLGRLPDNAGRFPAGLRDNFTIKLGQKAGLAGGHGGAPTIIFDLKEIKTYFWIIDRADLKEEPANSYKFTLKLTGKIKGDPKSAREALSRLCSECKSQQSIDGKSTVVACSDCEIKASVDGKSTIMTGIQSGKIYSADKNIKKRK